MPATGEGAGPVGDSCMSGGGGDIELLDECDYWNVMMAIVYMAKYVGDA